MIIKINKYKHLNSFNIFDSGNFCNIYSKKYEIPNQGWKIHISATFKNYLYIIKKVSSFCIKNNLSFKFVNNYEAFINLIAKSNNRVGFGKFITIYFENEEDFVFYIKKLDELLKRNVGPFILTDKQYNNNKVLYYRYGVNDKNQGDFLICPNGNKIKDRQIGGGVPFFIKDPFAKLNFISNSNIFFSEKDKSIYLKNNQYKILGYLAMSTGGGVYLSYDIINKINVVIKEAIPYVAANKDYSLIKLRKNEIRILKKLKNSKYVGAFLDSFYIDNHFFIVKKFLIGSILSIEAKKYEFFLYKKDNIKKLIINFENLVKNFLNLFSYFHNKQIIINDITLTNFIIDNKNNLFVIDLDNSFLVTDPINKKFKINHSGIELIEKCNLSDTRLDLHKLGILLLKIVCFGITYKNIEPNMLKDFEFLITLVKYYQLPSWIIFLLKDLIYKLDFELKDVFEYFEKYSYKLINKKLSNINKIKKINLLIERALKNDNSDFLFYLKTQNLENLYKLNFNDEKIFEILIITSFENWKKLAFFFSIQKNILNLMSSKILILKLKTFLK